MTTKILSVRVPAPIYSRMCTAAGDSGVSVGAYARRLLERESDAEQLSSLCMEILARIDALGQPATSPIFNEVLLLVRALAVHANPMLVSQVRAQLAAQTPEVAK